MRNSLGNNTSRLWKTTATGLVPLLLLMSVFGYAARQKLDWSNEQAVNPDTKTEVHRYKDRIPTGGWA